MHCIRKPLAPDTQNERYDGSETFWAAVAVTLLGQLAFVVVAAYYPIWLS